MFPTLRLMLAGVSALFLVTLGALSLAQPSSDRTPARVATAAFAPRGAMISEDDHPEWRQFRVQAALRRADELAKLRDLNDQPDFNSALLRWVSLPVEAQDHAPEEAVGAIGEVPPATMPVDIGEASAVELPVLPQEETVPPPARAKDAKDARQSSLDPVALSPSETPAAVAASSGASAVTTPEAAEAAKAVGKPAARSAKPASRPAVASKKKPRRVAIRKDQKPAAETNPLAALFGTSPAQPVPAAQ